MVEKIKVTGHTSEEFAGMGNEKAFRARVLQSQKLRGVVKNYAAKLCLVVLICATVSDLSAAKKKKTKDFGNQVETVKVDRPSIPKDNPISSSLGQQMIEADWLFQANHNPDQKQIAQEIVWARDLAARIGKMNGAPKLDGYLSELSTLENKLKTEKDHKKLYIQVRVVERKLGAIPFAKRKRSA